MLAQHELIMIRGKRSKRPRPASPLALTIATTSSTTAELSSGGFVTDSDLVVMSSPSNSGELILTRDEEEEDMANCLILLAKGHDHRKSSQPLIKMASTVEIYQCKTCNKSFHSFQALGGHRASHMRPNKPLGPVEKKYKEELGADSNTSTVLSLKISTTGVLRCNVQNKSRVHECSICGAEFASGQALGGHMRRHRPVAPSMSTSSHGGEAHQEVTKRPRAVLSLDLNLPAPEDDNLRDQSKFPFASKEQVIVFSSSPLVDCHF